MIHWDEKRPITVEILKRLSIRKLAALADRELDYMRFTSPEEPMILSRAVMTA